MYPVKKAYDRIGVRNISTLWLPYVHNSSDILNLVEFWDGGPMEGHLFIQKHEQMYILYELIHHFNTNTPSKYEYLLRNTDRMEHVVQELDAFCKSRYGGTLDFDFRKLSHHQEAFRFFGFFSRRNPRH